MHKFSGSDYLKAFKSRSRISNKGLGVSASLGFYHSPPLGWETVRTARGIRSKKTFSAVRTARAFRSKKLVSRSNGSSYPFKNNCQPFKRLWLSVQKNSPAVRRRTARAVRASAIRSKNSAVRPSQAVTSIRTL